MLWQDILIDRLVPDTALQSALAAGLNVPPASVQIVECVSDVVTADLTGVTLLVERTALAGDFPLQLSLYVRDSTLAQQLESPAESLDLVKKLCSSLDSSALLSDESLSPLSWLRVQPSGAVDAVLLDADRLDHDEFVVVSSRPAEATPTPSP
jgi:hypothetical protein